MHDIVVRVTKYIDRKYWMAYYVDPVTERRVTKSTRATSQSDAQRFAAKWEAELRAGRPQGDGRITWAEFRQRFEEEKAAALAPGSGQAYSATFNALEKLIAPKRLVSLTSATMSIFQSKLRKTGLRETTVARHLRHIKAALRWAESLGLMVAPKIQMPKLPKGSAMHGRPVTGEEFDRMLAAAAKVKPKAAAVWQRYLTGLWLSGLRLGEFVQLSWDDDAPFSVDLAGRHPRFRIRAEAQKSRRNQLLPMTPDFAEFILTTPEEERTGRVFPISAEEAGRVIAAIGKAAGVVVNKAAGKYASAHDLRRSFGTRWARKVSSAVLKTLMRHETIQTTESYYVDITADSVADELWRDHGPKINTSINSPAFSDNGQQWPSS